MGCTFCPHSRTPFVPRSRLIFVIRFLLAQLYLTALEDRTTVKAVKKALSQFKKQAQEASTQETKAEMLASAYDQAMERIHSQREGFRQLAQRVLTWITTATRPLSATELQHALAVELGERSLDTDNISSIDLLASVCSGLVAVDKESNVVRLIHYTTQEYFNCTRDRWFPSAEAELCATCVTYLSFDAFSSGFSESYTQYKERLKLYPLYEYSAHNWAIHARNASWDSSSNPLMEATKPMLDFLERDANVETAMQVVSIDLRDPARVATSKTPRKTTGLHFVARQGLDNALIALLKRGHNPDPQDSHGRTPLSYAAQQGHLSTARILLACPEVDAEKADSIQGKSPLMFATQLENEAMANLFLSLAQDRVDINRQDANGRTLLLWAAATRRWDLFLRLLDKHQADPTIPDKFGQTALALAAEAGETAIVVRLLAIESVDVDSTDICGLTPYLLAYVSGGEEVKEAFNGRLGLKTPGEICLPQWGVEKRLLKQIRGLNFDLPSNVLPVRCRDFNVVSVPLISSTLLQSGKRSMLILSCP